MQSITVSATSITTFQSCRKLYEYQRINHIYPIEREPSLAFGVVVHRGLECLFQRLTVSAPQEADLSLWKQDALDAMELAPDYNSLNQENRLKARALVEKYIDRYAIEDSRDYRVLSVEASFNEPLINPDTGRASKKIFVKGYADGIVRSKTNKRLYLLEHKTSGNITQGYFDRIDIDWQCAIYASYFERLFKEPIFGVIYDVLKKPAIRMSPGTSKKPTETGSEFAQRLQENITDEFFTRKIVEFDPEIVLEFKRDLWAVAKEMAGCERFYKCTGNCLKYGTCPYMELCRANGDFSQCDKYELLGNRITETLENPFE